MSEVMWAVYRLFHDPPGTPKKQNCVGCKVIAGGAGLTTSAILFYTGAKGFKKNGFTGSFCLLGGIGFILASAVSFRLAYDHHLMNEQLAKDLATQVRKERRANRDLEKPTLTPAAQQAS